MQTFKRFVFLDTDKHSETFNQWSIRWSDTMSIDGYPSEHDAMMDLWLKETNQAIRSGYLT
jgi:hypothetical protein